MTLVTHECKTVALCGLLQFSSLEPLDSMRFYTESGENGFFYSNFVHSLTPFVLFTGLLSSSFASSTYLSDDSPRNQILGGERKTLDRRLLELVTFDDCTDQERERLAVLWTRGDGPIERAYASALRVEQRNADLNAQTRYLQNFGALAGNTRHGTPFNLLRRAACDLRYSSIVVVCRPSELISRCADFRHVAKGYVFRLSNNLPPTIALVCIVIPQTFATQRRYFLISKAHSISSATHSGTNCRISASP